MEYRDFGKTGEKVSVIGIGAWQAGLKSWGKDYTLKDVIDAIKISLDYGVSLIDTAEIYGNGRSEIVLSDVLKEYKDKVLIATKVAGYNATPRSVSKAAERSRRRLGVDVIDIYQVHWPPSIYTDLCGLAKELERLVDRGIIRYIGVSNFDLQILIKFRECFRKYDIVSNQMQYNLLIRSVEKDLLPYMKRENMELIAWSPIAKGALAGKFKADTMAKKMDSVFNRARKAHKLFDILRSLSDKYGCKMHQIALAWLVSKGAIPIPGAKRPSQAIENAQAGDLKLDYDDVKLLDNVTQEYVYIKMGGIMSRIIPNWLQKIAISILGGV